MRTPETSVVVGRLVRSGRGDAALRLATAAFHAGRLDAAGLIAQAALDAGHQVSPVYYLLAACARKTGRSALSVDLARVGIALDPAPEPALCELAAVLLELGRPEEAAAALEAIPPAKRDRRARERLGLAYALAGQRTSARAVFKGLLGEDPSDERARTALRRLAPVPATAALDALARRLTGPLGALFARLRAGPATHEELAGALREAGYRHFLLKALIRDLAERTRGATLPLVSVEDDRVRLDLEVLDVAIPTLDVFPAEGAVE